MFSHTISLQLQDQVTLSPSTTTNFGTKIKQHYINATRAFTQRNNMPSLLGSISPGISNPTRLSVPQSSPIKRADWRGGSRAGMQVGRECARAPPTGQSPRGTTPRSSSPIGRHIRASGDRCAPFLLRGMSPIRPAGRRTRSPKEVG